MFNHKSTKFGIELNTIKKYINKLSKLFENNLFITRIFKY